MNTDIRLSVGFFSHPKTIKLMRQAGAEGVVCLQRLWIWAAQNRVDGCLVGFEADDIEIVAGWTGELGFLVRTLESLRFLDRNGDAYCLHGWAEHQEYVTQEPARIEKARRAAQKRWSNARGNANDGSGVMPDDASSNASSIARSNAPNQTNPNQEENTSPPVESLVNQDRARSPERGSEGGGEEDYLEPAGVDENTPSVEFQELRAVYNKHGRAGAPLAGLPEYLALKKSRQWPGQAAIYDAIDRLSAQDGPWREGKAPGLAKFLKEQWWRMKPRPPARASPPPPSGQTVTERNMATARQVLTAMEAEHGK